MGEPREKRKNDQVEWSFSFAELGEKIDEFIHSLGEGAEKVKAARVSEPVGGATGARVRLDLPVCETTVRGLAGSDNLIEAELTHIGEIKFAVSGDTFKTVDLSQQADAAGWFKNVFGWIGSEGRLRWNIGLTPNIPLDLDIHGGIGQSTFDLHDLNLSVLNVNGGTGQIRLTLPASSQRLAAQFSGGVGEFDVTVPAGASVDLQVRMGTGEANLDIGDNAAVTANIKGGVGECKVRLPYGAAARIEATMGLGDVSVPSNFTRVSGDSGNWIGKSGTWQTPNFDTAERRIIIHFEGGVGGLKVR